jgi:hypothetical protein
VQTKGRNLSSNFVSAFVLSVVEILCFWPIMGKVGFYLDDWATMAYLHFAPRNQGLLEFLRYYLLNDSRVQNRPLEVLHFGLLHWFAGGNPLHFHLFNLGLEVLAAILAYRIFVRVSGEKALSLVAALIFLLHPGHDSTHYWVICSSVSLSMLLYLVSLHFSLAFVDSKVEQAEVGSGLLPWLYATLAALFFLLSLLNYETLVPLAAINVLLVVALSKQSNEKSGWLYALKQGGVLAFALSFAIGLLLCYLRYFMPLLGQGYVHHAHLDWSVMVRTLVRGCELNLPFALGAFVCEQMVNGFASLNRPEWLRLAAIAVLGGAGVFFLRQDEGSTTNSGATSPSVLKASSLSPACLIAIGVFGLVVSYSVFGLNSDYEPTYYTMVNRINAGASFASSIALLGLLKFVPYGQSQGANKGLSCFLALVTALLVGCFTLTNFALARPWLVSWETQTTIRRNILAQKEYLGKGPTLLLVNCPRYVMWSPVFDGVWDFSNMLRIGLNDFDVNANVVSERMSIDRDGVKDVSRGFECGQYPFAKLKMVIAPQAELINAPDAKHFIQIVSTRGMGFGFPAKGLARWEEERVHALEKPIK